MSPSQGTAPAKAATSGTPGSRYPSSHGEEPLRGCTFAATALLKPGRFGRMFRGLPAADYSSDTMTSEQNLAELAKEMLKPKANASPFIDDPGADNDHPDARESGIPALYTYFGQFIDHDLTFDPSSSLQKQSDPDALVDYRTPAFDLDSVYGGGPVDQPYMYDDPDQHPDGSARLFRLGTPLVRARFSDTADSPQRPPAGWDLPRSVSWKAEFGTAKLIPYQERALIGDPRNDENVIVSQLHGLFLRFHNRLAKQKDKPSFQDVQRLVRFHYQYLILQDFLPRIVDHNVLTELATNGRCNPDQRIEYDRTKLKFLHYSDLPFMPVEFSVAAYRMGHSMVRPTYRLNDGIGNVRRIFRPAGPGVPDPPDLRGFKPVFPTWALDWGAYIDTEERPYKGSEAANQQRLQFAFRIDTSLVDPLAQLPDIQPGESKSLAERNLVRGLRLQLPSGQSVAHAMGIPEDKILKDKQILIGQNEKPIVEVNHAFAKNCPLWTYVLAEATQYPEKVKIPVRGHEEPVKTPKLGPVGGRIVAEVFLGLMWADPNSMLNLYPNWTPKLADPTAPDNYKLKDFVRYALGE